MKFSNHSSNAALNLSNAIASISDSTAKILGSISAQDVKNTQSLVQSQSMSNSISASVAIDTARQSTSISISNDNYLRARSQSAVSMSQSTSAQREISSLRGLTHKYRNQQTNHLKIISAMKIEQQTAAQWVDSFSNRTASAASASAQARINVNEEQLRRLLHHIKRMNQKFYQTVNHVNSAAFDQILGHRSSAAIKH